MFKTSWDRLEPSLRESLETRGYVPEIVGGGDVIPARYMPGGGFVWISNESGDSPISEAAFCVCAYHGEDSDLVADMREDGGHVHGEDVPALPFWDAVDRVERAAEEAAAWAAAEADSQAAIERRDDEERRSGRIETEAALEALTAELAAFCEREGLPKQCAMELLIGADLSGPQRAFLSAFVISWEATESRLPSRL